MSLKPASLLCLIFLLMITGAVENKWSMTYSQLNLCALNGSTVFMNATYTHPTHLTVKDRFWIIDPANSKKLINLRNEPGYSGRVKYLGDGQKHFSLRLSDVKKTDEHRYCFRITTNTENERWLGFPGVTLTVTELRVETPEEVVEGNKTVLVCNTTCSLSDKPGFIWYKNELRIDTNKKNSKALTLQPTKADDTGSYRCAVRDYEHLRSPARSLSVRYRPKNVSVSISPSGEIVEGSSVTLTCSSESNPPVENYTWFKGKDSSPVGSGQTYRALQSGQYYCEAQNKHGSERSAAVSITLNGFQSLGVYAGVGVVVFVCICLIVTFLFIRKKKRIVSTADQSLQQDNLYANIALANPISTVSDSASANQDEVLYATVVPPSAVDLRNSESSAVKPSVSAGEEVQYTSVRFTRTGADYRPASAEDPSVIYSRVK